MKMWSALFDASIQEDVDSPLFLFETVHGLLAIRKNEVHVDN